MKLLILTLALTATSSLSYADSATGYNCSANGIQWAVAFEESVQSDGAGQVVYSYTGEVNQDPSLGTSGKAEISYGGVALNDAGIKFLIINGSRAVLIPYQDQSEYQYQMIYNSIHADCELF